MERKGLFDKSIKIVNKIVKDLSKKKKKENLSQPIVQQVPATHPETVQHLAQPINLTSAEEVEFSVDSDSLPTPPPPQRLIMESCK